MAMPMIDEKPLLATDAADININYITPQELKTINYLIQQKQEAKEREKKQPIPRKLLLSLLFQVVFAVSVFGCGYIPNVRVESEYVKHWMGNEGWFPMGNFVLFYGLLVMGFLCVSLVICNRRNPVLDRKGSPKSFIKLLITGPLLFPLSPIFALASWPLPQTYTSSFTESLFNSSVYGHPFFLTLYNFGFYIMPFIIGLNFSILESFLMLKGLGEQVITGDFKNITIKGWVLVVVFAVLALGILGIHSYLLIMEGVMLWYAIAYCTLIVFVLFMSLLFREKWIFYPHHYFIALIFIPFTRFFNPFTTILQGLLLGVFVEGISRWGMSWIWTTKRKRDLLKWAKNRKFELDFNLNQS